MNFSEPLLATVANTAWIAKHTEQLKACFPPDWNAVDLEFITRVTYRFKLLGIDFRSNEDIAMIFMVLEKLGFMIRDEDKVKINQTWELSQITHFGIHPETETRHVH